MTKWSVGDHVYVTSLKKNGEIVHIKKNRKVTVAIGSIRAECREQDLTAPSSRRGATVPSPISPVSKLPTSREPRADTLDLHGLTREAALETLAEFLSSALLANVHMVDIVHGIGSGVLKSAVHQALESYSFVTRHAVLPYNPGTTRVYFD